MCLMSRLVADTALRQISLHFRGPLVLKQFAVYKPEDTKKAKRSIAHRRHGHAHFHERDGEDVEIQKRAEEEKQKRDAGKWITATINGDVVSWINGYGGQATPAPTPLSNGYVSPD